MYKCSLCLIAVVLFAAGVVIDARSTDNSAAQQNLREITVVKDVRNFLASHPGIKLTRLTKVQSQANTQSVRYSLGGRVTGDRLIAQNADIFAYPAPKDVSIQLTYPESGNNGAIVTYVEIVCTQDNSNGNAYVVVGGIGQRFISIVLEASQTVNFAYQAQYYGRD